MAVMTMSEMKAQIAAKAVKGGEFRARLIADPKSVIADELGISIPDHFNVQVHEDDSNTANFVLPPCEHLTEEDLLQVAGGGWGDTWTCSGDGNHGPHSGSGNFPAFPH